MMTNHLRNCCRPRGREGYAATRDRVAARAAGRDEAAARCRHHVGGQPCEHQSARDEAGGRRARGARGARSRAERHRYHAGLGEFGGLVFFFVGIFDGDEIATVGNVDTFFTTERRLQSRIILWFHQTELSNS